MSRNARNPQNDYEFLKVIGRGQFGVVQLVRCKEDNQMYVCKIIELADLDEAGKVGALQEVSLYLTRKQCFG